MDEALAVAMTKVQAVKDGHGATSSPEFLLGQLYARNAQLTEALEIAVQQLARLSESLNAEEA